VKKLSFPWRRQFRVVGKTLWTMVLDFAKAPCSCTQVLKVKLMLSTLRYRYIQDRKMLACKSYLPSNPHFDMSVRFSFSHFALLITQSWSKIKRSAVIQKRACSFILASVSPMVMSDFSSFCRSHSLHYVVEFSWIWKF